METENQAPSVGKVKLTGIDQIVRVTYTCWIVDEVGTKQHANGFADMNLSANKMKGLAKEIRLAIKKQIDQRNESKDKQATTPITKA